MNGWLGVRCEGTGTRWWWVGRKSKRKGVRDGDGGVWCEWRRVGGEGMMGTFEEVRLWKLEDDG